jgi:hypothetical protein
MLTIPSFIIQMIHRYDYEQLDAFVEILNK